MKLVKSSMALLLAAAALAAVGAASAIAAESGYPSKPVRMIAPYPPGGTSDIIARIVGQKLNEAWGQQIVVDSHVAQIAIESTLKAVPDGHTLLLGFNGNLAFTPALRRTPYDPVRLGKRRNFRNPLDRTRVFHIGGCVDVDARGEVPGEEFLLIQIDHDLHVLAPIGVRQDRAGDRDQERTDAHDGEIVELCRSQGV